MELLNATQLVAAYTQGLAPDGRESLGVIAKGTFDLPLNGREARLLEAQQPLLMADDYFGEPGLSAPLREMDFAPIKPFCDVLVHGSNHRLRDAIARGEEEILAYVPQDGRLSAEPEMASAFIR